MKLMILLSLFSLSTLVHATEVTVLESRLSRTEAPFQSVEARFQINQTTGQGYADVTVIENRYTWGHHYPGYPYPGPGWGGHHPIPQPTPTVIYRNKVAIEGLTLVGNKLMYQDTSEEVDCGTLGVSRVFKRPTIYLTGNCKLVGRVDRRNHLSVVLITK